RGDRVTIKVGDSRQGWVMSYQSLLELSTDEQFSGNTSGGIHVTIDLSDVRPAGEKLKGFGGVANPVRLPGLYARCARILNKAVGRQLNSVECCLLIDEAAACVVAGNIRRSAGMRQFSSDDELAATAKENLWMQDEDGNWRIDPERDALRMANHTRVFHQKPSLDECIQAVRKQYYSGEGAIQWAGEAKRRAQGDGRYGLNPCGEIIGENFHCNLAEVHLNQLDPNNVQEQDDAFRAGALAVAALLNHRFVEPRYQASRETDPIVGVSFTGLFDFFVHALGVDWLRWWEAGRPDTMKGLEFKQREQAYLNRWRDVVHQTVWDYCDRHGLKRPNRCTTVQPAGTKSLLTGASPGWHPPKAQRFIRRITFGKSDPVALACLDYGYSIVPAQSDKDEDGRLLDDPFDPRCTEWLVEIPTEVSWANLLGADQIDIGKFSALAQFDFYMQVQTHYTTHNTSATIELREHEIDALGTQIHETIRDDKGYISAALLARFDDHQTFPRLPFEPISKDVFDQMMQHVQERRQVEEFYAALMRHDSGYMTEAGPAGCDSDKCMLPEEKPQ
ncbi:MAG: ribonucleoside-triphosphate reductase, adenosylcobalamin-dependent, partial [Elainellaceae cyanobacterium]